MRKIVNLVFNILPKYLLLKENYYQTSNVLCVEPQDISRAVQKCKGSKMVFLLVSNFLNTKCPILFLH